MAEQWVSMAQAAATYGISTRTLFRRIKAGEFETRRAANGSTEVKIGGSVTIPPTAAESLPPVSQSVSEPATQRSQPAPLAIYDNVLALKLADVAEGTVRRLEIDLARARRGWWGGWAVAGILAITVLYGAWRLAEARTELRLASVHQQTSYLAPQVPATTGLPQRTNVVLSHPKSASATMAEAVSAKPKMAEPPSAKRLPMPKPVPKSTLWNGFGMFLKHS